MRLVHLDLKGAAPQVSYLEQVFPLLSQLGANGVLIEYEDMFPFKGELEILRSPYAYSEEDIERIQQLAEQHKLEVVPLVQTFGHVEVEAPSPAPHPRAQGLPWTLPDGSSPQFILKHQKYQHLREVERFPNSFNPHVPDTLALLKSILSQVVEKHRRSTWIHIGADEVFHLGEGMDSKNWMSHNKGDVGTMYLKHIKEVLGFLTAQFWGLRVLMWDDMLRKISVGALRGEGPGTAWWHLCQAPQPHPLRAHPGRHGAQCQQEPMLCPGGTWVSGKCEEPRAPSCCWHQRPLAAVPAESGIAKHVSPVWCLSLSLSLSHRYDHYSVLWELLPVSIPSLAICLQTLVNGGFTEEAKRKVLDVLGLESVQLEQSTCEGRGVFPGVEVYHMVEQVNGHLKESILKALEEESAIKGWFSPYHRKRQFGNPRNMESFGSKVLKLHEDWESFVRELRAQLERIYFPDTVEEWLEENVNPYLDQLRDLVRDYR
ncbi:HEXDC Hexosaminidase, partial [Prunella himalayana]|nr:HEXDC Hexosaminidase [Prunella himalayana]